MRCSRQRVTNRKKSHTIKGLPITRERLWYRERTLHSSVLWRILENTMARKLQTDLGRHPWSPSRRKKRNGDYFWASRLFEPSANASSGDVQHFGQGTQPPGPFNDRRFYATNSPPSFLRAMAEAANTAKEEAVEPTLEIVKLPPPVPAAATADLFFSNLKPVIATCYRFRGELLAP
jgi:hypothetical protein